MNIFKRIKRRVILILIIGSSLLVINSVMVYLRQGIRVLKPESESIPFRNSTDKLILTYSLWFNEEWPFGNGNIPFQSCPVKTCEITNNRAFLKVSDAVMFHNFDLENLSPPPKRSNQLFIMHSRECPLIDRQTPRIWRGLFNWTNTYYRDSDIPAPYGTIAKISQPEKDNTSFVDSKSINVGHKSKPIAWFVSNCNTPSKRELFVKELQKYIDVDVYGVCGKKCPGSTGRWSPDKCESMLTNYYFYLAFENAICKDYISEKLFKVFELDVVPIVRGGANYSAVIPQKWYINTDDFENQEHLAKYLKFLIDNPKEYLKYFDKKKEYEVKAVNYLCTLCQKLHVNDAHKVYGDIATVYSRNHCRKPNDI